MATSFDMAKNASLAPRQLDSDPKRKVFVTGAGGCIGSSFARTFASQYDLTLMVHPEHAATQRAKIEAFGQVVEVDLSDLRGLRKAMQGCDVVLHLAATPSQFSTWDTLLPLNIVGTYNVFVAAKAAGCTRMVYASSVHAVGGYPADRQIAADMPVHPGTLYGVTKCFGEALGRYMASNEGLPTICVRIGAHRPEDQFHPEDAKDFEMLVADSDLQALLGKCIEADHLQFAIAHGLSKCRYQRLEMTETCELFDYQPQVDLMEQVHMLNELGIGYVSRLATNKPEQSGLRDDLARAGEA